MNQLKRTEHGENIANQIQGEDAYGRDGIVTAADIWCVLDNIHTQYVNDETPDGEKLLARLQNWMMELERDFPGLDTY